MCWINNMNHIVVLAILPLLLLNGSESVLSKHLSLTRLSSSAKCNRQQQQEKSTGSSSAGAHRPTAGAAHLCASRRTLILTKF